MKEKLHKYKLNPTYPKWNQFKHDAFYTTVAVVLAAGVEIVLCHGWATGALPYQHDLWETPVQNAFWILFITHWRIPHFYIMHRVMHPWKREGIPDVGKWLYTNIHALHHRSYNPTAFSGTNMHPVESTLYFCAGMLAIPFGCHPTIVLACMIDCAVGAWLGHDGFQFPGSGDYFHQVRVADDVVFSELQPCTSPPAHA
jgi:sterol desaturase/sphingolipid hydroxylase (fatty acid hydroxylase superfamily)